MLGRLRRVIDPSPGGTTLYTYRPFGEPVAVTDAAGNVTSWSYNLRGFVTATSDPAAGNQSHVPNAFGELASHLQNESFGNGVASYTEYDRPANGWLFKRQAGVGGGPGLIDAQVSYAYVWNNPMTLTDPSVSTGVQL